MLTCIAFFNAIHYKVISIFLSVFHFVAVIFKALLLYTAKVTIIIHQLLFVRKEEGFLLNQMESIYFQIYDSPNILWSVSYFKIHEFKAIQFTYTLSLRGNTIYSIVLATIYTNFNSIPQNKYWLWNFLLHFENSFTIMWIEVIVYSDTKCYQMELIRVVA